MIDKWEIRPGSDPLDFYRQYLNETTSEVWGEFPEFWERDYYLFLKGNLKQFT